MQKEFDFLGVQILKRTFNIREKSQNIGWGIPTEMFIAQQPIAIESHREQKLVSNNCYDNILKP